MNTTQTIVSLALIAILPGCMIASVAQSTYGRFTSSSAARYQITDKQKQEIAADLPDPATVRFGEMAVMSRLVSGNLFNGRREARERVLVCGDVEVPGSMRPSPTALRRFAAEFESSVDGTRIGPLVDVSVDHENSTYARALCTAAEQI